MWHFAKSRSDRTASVIAARGLCDAFHPTPVGIATGRRTKEHFCPVFLVPPDQWGRKIKSNARSARAVRHKGPESAACPILSYEFAGAATKTPVGCFKVFTWPGVARNGLREDQPL